MTMPPRLPTHRRSLLAPALFLVATTASAADGESGEPARGLPRTTRLIAEKKPVRVVLYGDSISEVKKGWNGGASAPERNWGAVLVEKLRRDHPDSTFSIHHFAVGGQNSYEGLGRLQYLRDLEPDLVLVAFGANDCCHHFLLPEETKPALTTLATEIRKRLGADVVLVGTGGDNPLKPFFRHLDQTVEAQRKAAAQAKVPFVDMRAAILDVTRSGKNWADFHLNEGNCHPNDAGHEAWAEAALSVIRTALQGQRE